MGSYCLILNSSIMENQIKEQVAIVTGGAGSGIGEACALLFARLGATK